MSTWKLLHDHPDLWTRYFVREKVLTAIRRFFLDRKFHEVETPYLTGSLPPESYLEIFETTLLNRKREGRRAFLPTSPEPFLKKLLVAGIGNCFAIPKSFRNTENMSRTHNPEFTILEWYRVNADYTDIMDDCEELLTFINAYLQRTGDGGQTEKPTTLTYQGTQINLAPPWERLTMSDAFKQYAGIDLPNALTRENLVPLVSKKGYTVTGRDSWEELFHQVFFNEIEPHLGRGKPTIIYDYPVSLAALSRKKKSDPRFAERFEFYIEGLELGDAYSELTDATEQLGRFKEEEAARRRLEKIRHPIDMDFIRALQVGMPAAGGIAVGVDRLIMLFANVTDIADTLFFPAGDLFDL
jgi:elongation factor P--(R)-beta-lysine ligase